MRQTADGLQHAFEAGLMHRDIKPGNLLIDRQGLMKVLDLGLARFFDDEGANLTRKHNLQNVLGTADYLAPEQALDSSAVDIRGDIYSLGVTFYFALTGRSPYKDGSISQKLMFHQISQPTPLHDYRPEVPKKLAAIIEKMMAKDPAQRFQTPAELVDALEPWDEGLIMPREEEMPQLSPAAMGGQSTGRLPQIQKLTKSVLAAKPAARASARQPGLAEVQPASPRRRDYWRAGAGGGRRRGRRGAGGALNWPPACRGLYQVHVTALSRRCLPDRFR